MEVSEGNSPARGVWRWLRVHVRALGILVGLLLLYTLAGFLLVPRVARNAAINYVQHDLGRHLTIGSLSFNPFTLATEIRGFALSEADGAPIASFALLRIQFSATASLLHRAWTFAEVRLEQPVVNTLVMATVERRPALLLLRRVGATSRQLMSMTACQSALLTVVGIALGAAAGAVTLITVSRSLTGGWPQVTPGPALAVCGSVLALTLFATLGPTAVCLRRAL